MDFFVDRKYTTVFFFWFMLIYSSSFFYKSILVLEMVKSIEEWVKIVVLWYRNHAIVTARIFNETNREGSRPYVTKTIEKFVTTGLVLNKKQEVISLHNEVVKVGVLGHLYMKNTINYNVCSFRCMQIQR